MKAVSGLVFPWITFEVIDFLNKQITPSFKIFEYGGGGSTLFFLKRAAQVVTVEHDDAWFAKLSDEINKRGMNHWKGELIKAQEGDLVSEPKIAEPDHFTSEDLPSKGKNYKAYAEAIAAYNDNYFDLVMVDGRARPSCIKQSIPKIKPGGLLVLDNSDRAYYLKQTNALLEKNFELLINRFAPCPYLTHFTKTAVWRKKK